VQVRDTNTHAPIAGVEVKVALSNAPTKNWSSKTGMDGNAAFEHLPAGYFYVEMVQDGYIDSRAMGGAQTVTIKEGAAVELKLMLTKATSLQGRVLDEDGRPMAGVTVHSSWTDTQSDAEGRFRLENVRDGKCLLDFQVPMDFRRKTLVRDEESGTLLGYPSVEFYPGVADPREAQMIEIAAGMDLSGYQVRLRRFQLANVTGQTLARPDEPLAGVQVELQTSADSRLLDEALGSREVDANGRFDFELIPPGSYVLLIYRGANGSGLPYTVPLEVGKSGVKDKQIVVPRWQTIRGVLRVKDETAGTGGFVLTVASNQRGVQDRILRVYHSGEFTLEDIPPGDWQIGIGPFYFPGYPGPKMNPKLAITSARFGVSDAITRPITVAEGGNPLLEIEMSTDTGRIAGRLKGARQGTVLVERVGALQRPGGLPGVRINPDGSFLVENLAPGTYEVRRAAGNPVRVEVKAGETATVELE
jgi:hypothetical protein